MQRLVSITLLSDEALYREIAAYYRERKKGADGVT